MSKLQKPTKSKKPYKHDHPPEKSKTKFRVLYIEDCDDECRKTVVEIGPCGDYAIIGNSDTLNLKDFKKDWGKNARWGRYIKLP